MEKGETRDIYVSAIYCRVSADVVAVYILVYIHNYDTRFRPVAARSLAARGERSVLALTIRSAAAATRIL